MMSVSSGAISKAAKHGVLLVAPINDRGDSVLFGRVTHEPAASGQIVVTFEDVAPSTIVGVGTYNQVGNLICRDDFSNPVRVCAGDRLSVRLDNHRAILAEPVFDADDFWGWLDECEKGMKK